LANQAAAGDRVPVRMLETWKVILVAGSSCLVWGIGGMFRRGSGTDNSGMATAQSHKPAVTT
jgi:hypothetical protein